VFYREYLPAQSADWAGFGLDCLATPAPLDEPAPAPTCALHSKPPGRRTLLTRRDDFLLLATETAPDVPGYHLLTTLLVWRYRVWWLESTPYLQLLWRPGSAPVPSVQYVLEGSARHLEQLKRGWALIEALRGVPGHCGGRPGPSVSTPARAASGRVWRRRPRPPPTPTPRPDKIMSHIFLS
jgi:hypothetical protein